MMKSAHSLCSRLWPRTLFHRLLLIWFLALYIAHFLNFAVSYIANVQEERTATSYYLIKDVANAVHLLEQLPPAQRPDWLARLQRRNYRFQLGGTLAAGTPASPAARSAADAIAQALGPAHTVSVAALGDEQSYLLQTKLHDGTPLRVEVTPYTAPLSILHGVFTFIQLFLLTLFTWLAVRQATRPLQRLAEVADQLGTSLQCDPLPEDGPLEVVKASRAFNAMQTQIAEHLAERVHILAAISHDLQTPITRMRLRADLADSPALRDKLHEDLNAMQRLVEEGITYARSLQSVDEAPCRIDLDAFLDSLLCDYADAGRAIPLHGQLGQALTTRPHALRRILSNLLDNACKFGDEVELVLERTTAGGVCIAVLDRGPGIAPQELAEVLRPFYRIESSRNRETGGTGLGLAIAHKLSVALGGELLLANRPGGGLEARVVLPMQA